ncbi:MAG: hypothetical protein IJJ19_00555 [Erysipelotrichaceae bacterium]|nr:hypothetical protein [Erysipelotrichaceae bacterium]
MKNSLKIFLLLLTYVLIAVCTFGVVTYIYQVPVPYINDINYQLYGGIGAGVLGLILGFVAAFAKGKKAKAAKEVVKAAEAPVETREETEKTEEVKPVEEAPEEAAVETPVVEEVQPVEAAEELSDEEEEVSIDVPEETETPVEETIEEIAPVEEQMEEISEEEKIEPDDITKAFAPVVEPVEPLNNPVPTVIVSPLGPRNTKKDEVIEEVVSDEELADYSDPEPAEVKEETPAEAPVEEINETVEEQPVEEEVNTEESVHEEVKAEEPVAQPIIMSETQENFIGESKVSYIDEEGKPQFVITQNMETIRDVPEEEKKKNFVGYDVQAERRARMASTLNKILTFILIAALLAGIYFVYTKYLG